MRSLVRFLFIAVLVCSTQAVAKDSTRDLAERLEMKAMNGDAKAAYKLGLLFSQGKRLPADPVTAFEWFLRAAEAGEVKAMLKVSDMYLSGTGIDPSVEKSILWNERAAKKDSRKAMVKLGAFYATKKKYLEAAFWYKKAAVLGDVTAMREVAHYYYIGKGVHFNLQLSFAWLELAAKKKDRSSKLRQQKIISLKDEAWADEIRRLVQNRMIPVEYWNARN
ncbi:tetratricopeptide repeat protein [Terasakiella sp. SH-1]|uniref:tetratricopeptide repeat protein n=1 Tax=Terasakiella sp. SH-1 TaxID=2560057 RepID=UPI0014301B42|nr:tetratricopeptide repeat protein [Terasakiella sp. SH-1]